MGRLPLAGRTIVVTRPAAQADGLCAALAGLGAEALRFPLLTITPVHDPAAYAALHARLRAGDFSLAFFVSPNAVHCALDGLLPHGPLPATLQLSTVGKGSEAALAARGFEQVIAPESGFDSESVLALPAFQPAAVAGRRVLILAAAGMLLGYGSQIVAASRAELASRVLRVGSGADAFLVRPPPRPYGAWLNFAQEVLRRERATGTLLVLPEGLMLNYLTRMPSPVPPFFLFSFALRGEAESALVQQLEARPPDWIVALTRDLREYGVNRYGEREGEGKLLLAWIDRAYEPVASAEGRHPFDSPQGDLWVLRRRRMPGMNEP